MLLVIAAVVISEPSFYQAPRISGGNRQELQPVATSQQKSPSQKTANPFESAEEDKQAEFLQTVALNVPPEQPPPEGMVWVPGGEFSMGSLDPRESICGGPDAMQDARPIHRVFVDGFWMDATEVTNREFKRFVDATGYITVAERPPSPEEVPGVPADQLVAGSVVFTPTSEPVSLTEYLRWWRFEPGTNWKHPEGSQSDLKGRDDYPVVHVAYPDVEAFCKWAGKRLPSEAEWEFAARGGVAGELYPWGNDLRPGDKWMANIWQGTFPVKDEHADGAAGIAPVKQYPPNQYGLYDMAGNVWEWCADLYRPDYYRMLADQGGVARNPTGPLTSFDPAEPGVKKRVHRGGSFLCTDQYCTRYMVGSRGKGELNSGTNHTGFRCVMSPQQMMNRPPGGSK